MRRIVRRTWKKFRVEALRLKQVMAWFWHRLVVEAKCRWYEYRHGKLSKEEVAIAEEMSKSCSTAFQLDPFNQPDISVGSRR